MRRSDPDIVQNGHIYSSIREEEVFIIYWAYFDVFCGLRRGFCGRVLFCDNFTIGMVLVYYWNEKMIGFK